MHVISTEVKKKCMISHYANLKTKHVSIPTNHIGTRNIYSFYLLAFCPHVHLRLFATPVHSFLHYVTTHIISTTP